jgi:hypothetical protein
MIIRMEEFEPKLYTFHCGESGYELLPRFERSRMGWL